MSISALLAVTMMIGTVDVLRISRHTSMPDTRGSIRSSRMTSGWISAKRWSAEAPSIATSTRKPSRFKPTVSASMKLSSSSTINTVGVLMPACSLVCSGVCSWVCSSRGRAIWDVQAEGRALALAGLHRDGPAVVAGDVANDREAEAGAPGTTRTGAIDTIEAFEDPVEVVRGDADAAVGDHERHAVVVGERSDGDLAA